MGLEMTYVGLDGKRRQETIEVDSYQSSIVFKSFEHDFLSAITLHPDGKIFLVPEKSKPRIEVTLYRSRAGSLEINLSSEGYWSGELWVNGLNETITVP
jgi:hypothetical protein